MYTFLFDNNIPSNLAEARADQCVAGMCSDEEYVKYLLEMDASLRIARPPESKNFDFKAPCQKVRRVS